MSHLKDIDEQILSSLEAIRDADDVDDWDLTFVISEEVVCIIIMAQKLTPTKGEKEKGY